MRIVRLKVLRWRINLCYRDRKEYINGTRRWSFCERTKYSGSEEDKFGLSNTTSYSSAADLSNDKDENEQLDANGSNCIDFRSRRKKWQIWRARYYELYFSLLCIYIDIAQRFHRALWWYAASRTYSSQSSAVSKRSRFDDVGFNS